MSGAKKMVTGFNHNIRHNGKIYHIQTEDSGLGSPHIITHLFLGGNILASKKTSYADLAGADNLTNVVRELMEEQHKEVLRNLVNGVYDTGVPSPSSSSNPSIPAITAVSTPPPIPKSPAFQAKPAADMPPPNAAAQRASVEVKSVDSLFGEDLISEKSLDEVILSYLAEDSGPKK